jgi:thiol-disulfide isomerase/thioredoxin
MRTFIIGGVVSFLLISIGFVQAESTTNISEVGGADAAWKEVQQAAIFPDLPDNWPALSSERQKKLLRQRADAAAVAAEKAKAFCTTFSANTNAFPALKLQCEMLEMVFDGNRTQDALMAWGNAQDALLEDSRLTTEDHLALRISIIDRKGYDQQLAPDARHVEREKAIRELIKDYPNSSQAYELLIRFQRKQFDHRLDQNERNIERERGIREMIKEYPDVDKPYEMLLALGAVTSDVKARAVANDVLALHTSENVKAEAEGILRRLAAVGKPLAIQFTALDGRPVDLSQMKGKVVLVDFWATWCGPCIAEIPQVKEAYDKFHARGFEVIGISFDSSKTALDRFIQTNELPWPQYFDDKAWANKFGVQFGIRDIPTMWLVDKVGNLREVHAADNLEAKVEKLLNE